MNLLEAFSEVEILKKHTPKDILLFTLLVACVVNLHLYFKFVDSGKKTEIVINSETSNGEVQGVGSNVPTYISGAVNFPGVYVVTAGSLMSDVLREAGGFSSSADAMWISKNLNLSEVIKPNSKIYIPFNWDTEYMLSTATEDNVTGDEDLAQSDGDKLNVNTATLEELDELEGIGPVFAQKIIDNRPYADFDEFKTKSGLSENLANSLSEYVNFD